MSRPHHKHLLEAAKAEYLAKLLKYKSELKMLIFNGVGVGDHSQMVSDVVRAIDSIDEAVSRLETVDVMIEELDLLGNDAEFDTGPQSC